MAKGLLIIDGKKHPCDALVKTWEDHGKTFVQKPGTIPQSRTPEIVLWHWTGGENSALGTYDTLIQRGLGVTFCIDNDGVVWQFVDPAIWDPKDTGGAIGLRCISIEVANYGFVMKGQKVPTKGRDRILDEVVLHGQKMKLARFWPQQIESLAALTTTLCQVFMIPLVFPREADGSLALRLLTPKELRAFKGVMGHFHKTDQKFDPGFHVFRELEHLVATKP